MPEGDKTTTPPDGGAAGAAAGAAASGSAGAAGTGGSAESKKLELTQAEFDAIIQDRLRRAVPADYEDFKKKAGLYDEAQTASMSDLQKAQEKAAKAEAATKAAEARVVATLRQSAILAEAVAQSAVDPMIVVALLGAEDSITVGDDGAVKGAKAAVTALLKEKPFLVKGAPRGGASGGEFGGNDGKPAADRIRELQAAGKWREARDLQYQEMSASIGVGPSK